jgi:WD40 repeat-containing protein SMU1
LFLLKHILSFGI